VSNNYNDVAIIGMMCRYPGARNVTEFWNNLREGVESIRFYSEADLVARGVEPEQLRDPRLVRASGELDDIDRFDAPFFGYTPREAEVMDPQHRIFLECAWAAFEDAGYNSDAIEGRVGVFAGVNYSSYLITNLLSRADLVASVGAAALKHATDKDYVATRTSYKLNLRGPSLTVQTACSTSLVAVHLACQSLLSGESDMALAGGASIAVPQDVGYFYAEGGMESPDGHCRPFDRDAQGTVFSNGCGVVVLKRLEEAIKDNDHIYAVIKASSINNDGAFKVGYVAPSVQGQTDVITDALAIAAIDPDSIQYVEAHGTATPLGDPIEVAALIRAFGTRASNQKKTCALGSVKSNIGHANTASGVAGLIKTALALTHAEIPPSLNFRQPNAQIDFEHSPFYVNTQLVPWPAPTTGRPRCAGVSSFGIGGTNAHVILEEAPTPPEAPDTASAWRLFPLSAKSPTALEAASARLGRYLQAHPQADAASIAYTLQMGRRSFAHRRAVLCRSASEGAHALEVGDAHAVWSGDNATSAPHVVFMFPGQGCQYVGMGHDLYETEAVFRSTLDHCATILQPHLGVDLRSIIYPSAPTIENANVRLAETALTQPILCALEIALARLWMHWGVEPTAMIGHSIGEFAAAHLAGVFSLEEVLAVVAMRGRLMQEQPGGQMLAIQMSAAEVQPLLSPALSLAAINTPTSCVVAGPEEAIAPLHATLQEQGRSTQILKTSHAFHSSMMEPIIARFHEYLQSLTLHKPQRRLMSNVTGEWMTPEEATSPSYWAQHLRQTVRFADGVAALLASPAHLFLECGPTQVLTALVRQCADDPQRSVVASALRSPQYQQYHLSQGSMRAAQGQLWATGVEIVWSASWERPYPRRVALPAYPFERHRYWIDVSVQDAQPALSEAQPMSAAALAPSLLPVHYQRPGGARAYVAPRTTTEQLVSQAFAEILGLAPIGRDDDFYALGGNSLLAVQLLAQVRQTLDCKLPLATLLATPMVADLATAIDQLRGEGVYDTHAQLSTLIREDIVLDARINVVGPATVPSPKFKSIFLTGATGFLGAFLLDALLTQTDATIYCLVRAADEKEGLHRISDNLVRFHRQAEGLRRRVTPICGTLADPRLQMSEVQFDDLATSIDTIIHAAAIVNMAMPYSALRVSNVHGTHEVLRLAAQGQVKSYHHISTTAVFADERYPAGHLFMEQGADIDVQHLASPYGQSKWAAEQLVVSARGRGLPTAIYRVGNIAGDLRSGACNMNDLVWRLIKGCLMIGQAPSLETRVSLTPVDYVSRAIVHLAQHNRVGRDYNIVAPHNPLWSDMVRWIQEEGYQLSLVPYDEWRARLIDYCTPDNPLYPLLHAFPEDAPPPSLERHIDGRNAATGLADSNLVFEPFDARLMHVHLGYLERSGFLPAALRLHIA